MAVRGARCPWRAGWRWPARRCWAWRWNMPRRSGCSAPRCSACWPGGGWGAAVQCAQLDARSRADDVRRHRRRPGHAARRARFRLAHAQRLRRALAHRDLRSVASGIGGCRAVVLGRPAIAHALVSFGFGDGRHVVFSVEVRRKLGDAFSEIGASSASTSCRCWRPPKRTACGYAPMCAARTVTCIACTCPRAGARVVPGLCRDGQRAGASTALLQHADRQLHHHRVPAGPAHRARAADGLPAAAVRLSARIPVPHRRARAARTARGPIATPAAIPTARAPRPTRRSSRAISARACPANEEGLLAACRLPPMGQFSSWDGPAMKNPASFLAGFR